MQIVVTANRMSDPDFAWIMWAAGERREEDHPQLGEGGGEAPTGFGGIDPQKFPRETSLCPPDRTCVPEPGTDGMYVRDVETNTIYFSEMGYERVVNGANINWAGVASDLLRIVGQAGGFVNASVIGILWFFVDLTAWGVEFLFSED